MNVGGINPADDTLLFDVVVFDGVESPGVVGLSGFEREQNLDVKESDGQKGATTTYKGTKCGGGTLTFTLIKDDNGRDDFLAWDAFAERFWSTIPPKSGKKPVAKDISHPDLLRNDYTSVILRKMGRMQHDGKGGATIAVDVAEYYPPKPAATGGASGSKSQGTKPDPVADATKELEELLKKASQP